MHDGGSVGIIGDGRNDGNDGDEQSGALHMFAFCLAIFALPTLPWSSLGVSRDIFTMPHSHLLLF